MSGLKINVDKTRALWIGSSCGSSETLCDELALDWSQEPLKILGVTFSPLVFNISDLNSKEILVKIKNILNQWSKRKLSQSGKITVIKSLAVSKFVHLFISLTAPPHDLIKELEKMFYKFLWNSGPDRIKRRIIIKNIGCAGLRMIELRSFVKALKLSWLRRILQQSKPCEWSNLSNINFQKFFSVGSNFASKLSDELQNPFWKDLMHVWAEFCRIVPVEDINQIIESPLWFNDNIGRGKIFFKNWHDKGIRTISDILSQTGDIYTLEQLKSNYSIKGTFLDYQKVINNIPHSWKMHINNNKMFIVQSKMNVICNIYVKKLIKNKKGSRVFYDTFVNINEYIPQGKWQEEIGDINENEWKTYFQNIKHWHEVKIRDFQYKIDNKIFVTNSFLHKIKKIDNGNCTYCMEHPEKIYHLFISCPKIKKFWRELRVWLQTNANVDISLEERKILFSYTGKDKLKTLFMS